MSINQNYMQKIKYVFATAFFAIALAFISMPTATFAEEGYDFGGSGDYSGYGSYTTDSYGYATPSSGSYTTDSYGYAAPSYGNYTTDSYGYATPSSGSYTTDSYGYATPSYGSYTTDSYGYATPSYSSTPSYSYGCSNCGGSAGYSTGYSTGSGYGCTNCGSSNSTPAYSYGCSNCGGSSVPSYTYSPSSASSYSSSNPTNTSTNTNTNTTGPSTSTATGGSASSTNTNSLVNNSPVNVVNNIVVNVPGRSGGTTSTNNDLSVNCSINPTYNVQIGQDVNFYANASGGNGNYSYSWSGSDGLNSSSQSFTGRFYSAGSKYATVTVYSGGQSRSQTCNTNVGGSNNGNLSAYCTATPSVANTNQYVTWTAYPTGWNGNYSYYWTGSDGLNGYNSSVSQSYGSTGQKSATVTITSNGQSITATCYSTVNAIYGYQTQASNVTLIKGTSDQIATASGIYLGQLPATGISLSWKVALFAIGLLMWSLFAAYVVLKRKKATGNVTTNNISDFKARMLAMKNK